MPALIVNALVLRASEYKDYDRILTLLAQERGRLTATARGVRRPKAALRAAAEPFVFSRFWLFEKQGRYTVTGAEIIDAFYPLRTDVRRLSAAALMTQMAEDSIGEGSPQDDLIRCLLEGYAAAAYGDDFLEGLPAILVDVLTRVGFKPPERVASGGLGALVRFAEEKLERRLSSAVMLIQN